MSKTCEATAHCQPNPSRHTTVLEAFMNAFGVMFVIVAICIPGPGFTGPFWMLLIPMAVTSGIAIFLFWGAGKVGNWQRLRSWKKEFLIANADLNLDLKAVKKVEEHIKKNTGYIWHNSNEVLTSIASSLRRNDPYSAHYQNSWSYETINAYRFFKDGVGRIIPTSCPKY